MPLVTTDRGKARAGSRGVSPFPTLTLSSCSDSAQLWDNRRGLWGDLSWPSRSEGDFSMSHHGPVLWTLGCSPEYGQLCIHKSGVSSTTGLLEASLL